MVTEIMPADYIKQDFTPARKIIDPLHGFIAFDEMESALIDSAPFQRLRYIRQLGGTYFVYPGATHSRFEHSLGTMELATRIFDRILQTKDTGDWLPSPAYAKKIVRLAALCHDLGHLPFSHVPEELVLGPKGHEERTVAIIRSEYLKPLWSRYASPEIEEDVIRLAVGRGLDKPWHKALSQIIAGDFFGADRIDYLLRDAKNTGVTYGMFDYHQLIEMIRILPFEGGLKMGVEEGAIEACEALLLARHFMHQRVYQYPGVKGYAFHLSRYIAALLGPDFKNSSLGVYLSWTDNEILFHLRRSDDEHAQCLLDRRKRYRALYVSDVPKEILEELEAEGFHLERSHPSSSSEKTFPVLRTHGGIASSAKVLQVQIPSRRGTWIYAPPQNFRSLETRLSKFL
jgi:HD superfamily phosphohydrolase